MEGESGTLMTYVNQAIDFMRAGFREVNAPQGLIIALIGAIILTKYGRILVISLGATVAHLVIDILLPVFAYKESFRLPPNLFEMSYWSNALFLFVGYIIVITVLYIVKRLFLSR